MQSQMEANGVYALANKKTNRKTKKNLFIDHIKDYYQLYLLCAPAVIYFIVFHYIPMYGVQIAFKNFLAVKGIMDSPWVGFEHFERFFRSYTFWTLIKNTLGISLYHMAVEFPGPIILAILLNEVQNKFFKKTVQMVTYAPHFISVVVLVGMMTAFLSPSHGIINQILMNFGVEPISFMTRPEWFKTIYVFSGVWQNIGYGSIIYMAALSGIDPSIYEAAIVDGATKIKRIWYIDIPGIMPTIVILLILNVGRIMSVGFEKVFLMQNALNMTASDVISTYVYRVGILGAEYSFSAAVGLFNSVINFILLITVNQVAKKMNQSSLW